MYKMLNPITAAEKDEWPEVEDKDENKLHHRTNKLLPLDKQSES